MAKNLYFELDKNGYHILDHNDPLFHVHQYAPHIPNPARSYIWNARAQIRALMVEDYTQSVRSGAIQLDDVPEEYRDAVKEATEADQIAEKAKAYDIITGVAE